MELSDNELAVQWFDRLNPVEKSLLLKKLDIPNNIILTANDKEWIWRREQKI